MSTIQGTLYKKGDKGLLKDYKERFFKFEGLELHYYSDITNATSQGFIGT